MTICDVDHVIESAIEMLADAIRSDDEERVGIGIDLELDAALHPGNDLDEKGTTSLIGHATNLPEWHNEQLNGGDIFTVCCFMFS